MDINSLKTKRSSIKASCTRIRTYIESIQDVDQGSHIQLQLRKDKLATYWSVFEEIQAKLDALEPDPE